MTVCNRYYKKYLCVANIKHDLSSFPSCPKSGRLSPSTYPFNTSLISFIWERRNNKDDDFRFRSWLSFSSLRWHPLNHWGSSEIYKSTNLWHVRIARIESWDESSVFALVWNILTKSSNRSLRILRKIYLGCKLYIRPTTVFKYELVHLLFAKYPAHRNTLQTAVVLVR